MWLEKAADSASFFPGRASHEKIGRLPERYLKLGQHLFYHLPYGLNYHAGLFGQRRRWFSEIGVDHLCSGHGF